MKFLKKIFGADRQTAHEAYKMGIHHYNQSRYGEAIPYLEQVVAGKAMSNSLEKNLSRFYCGRAYINLGITHFANSENELALDHFTKALAFNPDDTDLNYFIGICQNNIGEYQAAMDSFTKILETEPWNIPTKLKMSIIFHNLEMWENAEEIQRSILLKHPQFADVHFHLGLSLMSQNKTEEAAQSFSSALDINPNYVDARLKLGIVQICLEQYGKALENLEIILKRNPGYADVYYLVSLIKEKSNKTEEGIRYLEQALKISPRYKNALVKLIIFHCQTGNLETAQEKLDQAFALYPDDKRLGSIEKYLSVFSRHGQDPDAEKLRLDLQDEFSLKELRNEFHKDLDIIPNFSEIIAMFSSSRYAKEDASISSFLIPIITEQINKNPMYPDLYNSLGTQLMLSNKLAEAESAFSKAIDINPDYVTARVNMLKALQRSGKNREALEHGLFLVKKNLPFPDVYYTLTKVLIALKKYDDAMVNAKRVLRLRPAMTETLLLVARIHEAQGNYEAGIKAAGDYLKGDTKAKGAAEARKLLDRMNSKFKGTLFCF